MKPPLVIVAKIEAKHEHIDQVKAALIGLIAPTLKEAGCIQYDLHQDDEDPAVFLFYEIWESRELWQDHMNSAHINAFRESDAKDAIENITVHEMSKVD